MYKKRFILNLSISIILIGCLLLVFSMILFFKFKSVENWLYTSDLFTYDTMLQETLKGFFGMEYTYGNLFGDHASLLLLFFLPLKWILGEQMVYFMLMITPALYLFGGMALLYFLKKSGVNRLNFIAIGLLYVFQMFVYYGNYEGHYGYHIDTGSGYLIVIVALLMVLKQNNAETGRLHNIIFFTALGCYLLLKEEMALLAVIFFLLSWAFQRKRRWMIYAVVSMLVFLGELWFIHFSKTAFNRGNVSIVESLIVNISEQGIFYFFKSPDYNKFWLPVIVLSFAYALLCRYNKFNSIGMALFITAFVKIAFSFAVADFELYTWHSFPALVMITASVLIQAAESKKEPGNYTTELTIMILYLFFVFRMFNWDVVYINSTNGCINANKGYKNEVISDLNMVKNYINKDKVIALNGFLAFDFRDGYRYSFFPRGISLSPRSIADYILYEKSTSGLKPVTMQITLQDESLPDNFKKIIENKSFILLEREHHIQSVNWNERLEFAAHYGRTSIGWR